MQADPFVAALVSLCQRVGGHRVVAESAHVSEDNLWQIINGTKLPSGNPRGVGPALRKKIAAAYPDWLRPPSGQGNTIPAVNRGKVPVISAVRAGNWGEINDHVPDTDRFADARFSTPSRYAFALEVEGDSMVSDVGPSFPAGTIIIVEPERSAKPGDFVVAKDVSTQRGTFKRLMTDGSRWYLKPLNRDYLPLEIDDPAKRVIGVVIEFWNGGKL